MDTLKTGPFTLRYKDVLVQSDDVGRLRVAGGTASDPPVQALDELKDQVEDAISDLIGQELTFSFVMSSLNFGLNQEVLTSDTEFTADLSFDAGVVGQISLGGTNYTPVQFDDLLKRIYDSAKALKARDTAYYKSLRTIIPSNLRDFFEGFVFRHWENVDITITDPNDDTQSITIVSGKPESNLSILYYPHNEVDGSFINHDFDGNLSTCNAAKKSADFSKWSMQLRFVQEPPEGDFADGMHYPYLHFINQDILGWSTDDSSEEEIDFANDQISIDHEVLILPANIGASPSAEAAITLAGNNVSNAIGKVANEISETIMNIGSKVANNLTGTFKAQLQPVGGGITKDIALWVMIKRGTEDLSFENFSNYMDAIFCGGNERDGAIKVRNANGKLAGLNARRHLPFPSVDAYRSVKVAAEAFVMVNCMVKDDGFSQEDLDDLSAKVTLTNGIPDPQSLDTFWDDYLVKARGTDDKIIPYLAVIRRKLGDVTDIKTTSFEGAFQTYLNNGFEEGQCYGIIEDKLLYPCFIELIWSYWIEESMMVQGLKAILRRFQNIRGPGANDPLANLLVDPLRPLSNLLWGYAQDEQHRLTVLRRGYEYNSHYGITPHGKVLQNMRFADSRSKFMEAFHTLLNMTSKYYKQADDMTVKPDGFPILNALKETHLILSEGAHNQFGDLPFVARTEMLMEQWLLSRGEFREFLPTRTMVAYPEPWMDRVSAMNNLMGWTNSSVLHFRDLARFGEQILLSIRYGNWANTNSRDSASHWAEFWREQIQGYIHAYRAVTSVDLTADIQAGRRIDAQQPSVHLRNRLAEQLGSRQNGRARQNGVPKHTLADDEY